LPILDAFNSPLKIDNLWSDGLVQDYNFSKVRRFDRCTTCHQSMSKTLPGSAVDPAFVHEERIEFTLQTSGRRMTNRLVAARFRRSRLVQEYFGVKLADSGW
jgi:hypothetical protein